MQPITRDRIRWAAMRAILLEVLADSPPPTGIGMVDDFTRRVCAGATVPELAREFDLQPNEVMAQLAWLARG